jgi:RNA polymerase sigma factor (sigma-70 family)
MSNSAEPAIVGEGEKSSRLLSDDQLAAFWDGILRHRDAACRFAARFVPRQDVEDVVHTAAVRFIESMERPVQPKPFPADDDEFRRRFLHIIRNHGINCSEIQVSEAPVHAQWGTVPEPIVAGSATGDRQLDHVFAHNDGGKYDVLAPVERRPEDDIPRLHLILREHLQELPPMQRRVIDETFFKERKRAAVAASLGISVKTYDCHLQAAYGSLRHLLTQDALASTEIHRSGWYDLIEELRERYDAVRVVRVSRKKGKRSTSEHESSNSEGERPNARDKSGNAVPAGAA